MGKSMKMKMQMNTSCTYVDDLNFLAYFLHVLHNVENYFHIFRGFSILNLFQSQQQQNNFLLFILAVKMWSVQMNGWMLCICCLLENSLCIHPVFCVAFTANEEAKKEGSMKRETTSGKFI